MTEKGPLFVARDGYRLRRAKDAVRLLPILGAILILMPILWAGGSTRVGIIYLFVVWLGLIISALILSRRLKEPEDKSEDSDTAGPDNGSV